MNSPCLDETRTGWRTAALLLAILALGAVRVVSTYQVFSPTYDEPAHIATGMEWIEKGTYEFAAMHPPLARVFAAAPLYWSGIRMSDAARQAHCRVSFLAHFERIQNREHGGYFPGRCLNQADERILWRGDIVRNTALARLGVLPFFLAACLFLFLLGRALFDTRVGLLAAFIFSSVPVVLGHAALATTDVAATATYVAVLYFGFRWVEGVTLARSLALGVALGLAVLSKFSNLLFLPIGLAPLLWLGLRCGRLEGVARPGLSAGLTVAVTGFVMLWAAYRFSLGPPAASVPGLAHWVDGLPVAQQGFRSLITAPLLPAPDLVEGLFVAFQKNQEGHATFLLGEPMRVGVWPFFPVVFLAKSPLALLAALGLGLFVALRGRAAGAGPARILAVVLLLTFAVAMGSKVNIGLRHVLSLYVATSLIAAFGLAALASASRLGRAVALLLIGGYAVASLAAHPEYFTYFNLATASHPERIVVDSDLDWGQDVYRLADVLADHDVDALTVCAYGFEALSALGPFAMRRACPTGPEPGWLAVSLNRVVARRREALAWLADYEPVARVGKSILLYRFSAPVPP